MTSWMHLGCILGASWDILGTSWDILEPSWRHLGASWGFLGPSGAILKHLEASWKRCGAKLGGSWWKIDACLIWFLPSCKPSRGFDDICKCADGFDNFLLFCRTFLKKNSLCIKLLTSFWSRLLFWSVKGALRSLRSLRCFGDFPVK